MKITLHRSRLFVVHCLALAWAVLAMPASAANAPAVDYHAQAAGRVEHWHAATGDAVFAGDLVVELKYDDGSLATVRAGASGRIASIPEDAVDGQAFASGDRLFSVAPQAFVVEGDDELGDTRLPAFGKLLSRLWTSTGLHGFIKGQRVGFSMGFGRVVMICVGLILLYLAIVKEFEPLLLLPIGFGAVLTNIPLAGIGGPDGLLGMVYEVGITTGVFPLIIFMGVGALTDFGPMIANPKTALLGAAAQFGIFATLFGAVALNVVPGIDFSLADACAIGIIGGADGPTSIFLASRLSPRLLGAIAVAAYSYMALVPIIQPPIMRALTSPAERAIRMTQLRDVSKLERIFLPLLVLGLCCLLLPSASPLIGMLMFGNLMKECGVVERLTKTTQTELINIVTIFLGLAVGSKLSADKFLNIETLGILALGLVAFCIGTATGVLMAKLMNRMSGGQINPLIGAAGVSAVPMAARVVNRVGLESDSGNFLLMHAMGPNVSGVIGSAVAAGVLLAIV